MTYAAVRFVFVRQLLLFLNIDSNGDFTVATEGGDGDDEDPDNDVSLT